MGSLNSAAERGSILVICWIALCFPPGYLSGERKALELAADLVNADIADNDSGIPAILRSVLKNAKEIDYIQCSSVQLNAPPSIWISTAALHKLHEQVTS